jgi:hypothetical protein
MNEFTPINGDYYKTKERAKERREFTERWLKENGIGFDVPNKGQYRIPSKHCCIIMFYPKSGVLKFKRLRKTQKVSRFYSSDAEAILNKIRELQEPR